MAAVGRAFRIKKKDVNGYGYARPRKRLRSNPGVTTIAAINGRGAYSARSSMSGVRGRRARLGKARGQLSAAQKRAFVEKMRANQGGGRRLPVRRPRRAGGASSVLGRRRKRLSANRRSRGYVTKFQQKTRTRRRVAGSRKKTRKVMAKLRKKAAAPRRRRRRASSRRVKRTRVRAAAPKRRRRKAKAATPRRRKVRAVAPKRRRRRAKAKAAPRKARRRRMRRNRWGGDSAGHARAARKGWRKRRKTRSAAPKRRRRKVRAAAPKRRRRKAGRRKTTRRTRRRVSRRVASSMKSANRRGQYKLNRRRSRRGSSRRRMRSNRRRAFRRNEGFVATMKTAGMLGVKALGGFVAQKALGYLVSEQLLARVIGKPEAAAPPAVSGLEVLQPYRALIGGTIAGAITAVVAVKTMKNSADKTAVVTGAALGMFHNLLVTVLNRFQPKYAAMLSGYEDGTAARLSAMYGMGASIMPHYAPINGVGEYFTNGVGEYFTNGVGEYFTNGTAGLGALPSYEAAAGYGANPDLMQAAAGYGATEVRQSNFLDPNSNLERELDIAEAAAGVGSAYEAAAGMGSISRVPSANTWIPGTSDGQLWAGTRAINSPQSASEMVPAGILETGGGQGVFG